MLYLTLLLLTYLPQAQAQPAQESPSPAGTYDQGPLSAEILAMREIRFSAPDPEMAARLRSELGIQFRIRGADITRIMRQGTLIFDELTDDTGKELVDPTSYTEADRTVTRPVSIPADRLRSDGLIITTRAAPTDRAARTLKHIRASIRLILADKTEKITILNPLQYYGQTIEDPRLRAMGIEVQLLPPEQLQNPPPPGRCVVVYCKTRPEQVYRTAFYDGSMRQISAREGAATLVTGEPCVMYVFDAGSLNDEMQLVLDVHPRIDDLRLPIEMDDVPLP